jgi:carboxyl-terminal processing protease
MKTRTKILIGAGTLVLLAGIFVAGMYIGFQHRPFAGRVTTVGNTEVPSTIHADFEPFWKVWNLIDQKYPDAGDLTAQERVYGAIQGLIGSTKDPYSVFFPPVDSKDFQQTIEGRFEGIGMEIGIKDEVITVIAPLKNTPAEAAGIKSGDKVLKIDDKSTSDMSVDEAVSLIRGTKGTVVKLTIYREGSTKTTEISVTRAVINIPTLDSKLRDDGVFVISLYNFSASSGPLMEDALIEFTNSGSKKLIIDLRGNPGGYLDSAVDMASFFLPEGETVVTEDFGKNGEPKVYRSRGFELLNLKNIKVVVLADKGSASASEILAGALQQHHVAKLIGETTYGKGSVQEVLEVTKDTTIKITVAKWLTPDGTSISLHGLKPDIEVIPTEKDIANKVDPVLNRALEYFRSGK